MAALSVEALAAAGGVARISAGKDSSAEVEVDAGAVGLLHSSLHNIRGQCSRMRGGLSGSCILCVLSLHKVNAHEV